jgi:hypothetical protein
MEPLPVAFPGKLGAWDPANGWTPVRYSKQFCAETISGFPRLLVATDGDALGLFLRLAEIYEGPFRVGYLLVSPPVGYEPSRYELDGVSHLELTELVLEYQDFLRCDARHHLWLNAAGGGTLILDEHDWLYSYGRNEAVESYLRPLGFEPGKPELPFPHIHNESSENTPAMEKLLASRPWRRGNVSNMG